MMALGSRSSESVNYLCEPKRLYMVSSEGAAAAEKGFAMGLPEWVSPPQEHDVHAAEKLAKDNYLGMKSSFHNSHDIWPGHHHERYALEKHAPATKQPSAGCASACGGPLGVGAHLGGGMGGVGQGHERRGRQAVLLQPAGPARRHAAPCGAGVHEAHVPRALLGDQGQGQRGGLQRPAPLPPLPGPRMLNTRGVSSCND